MRFILFSIFFALLNLQASELPSFKLPEYNTKTTFEYKKGKKTVINFWASWCTGCIKEIPILENLKSKNHNVDFLAVNAGENKKKIKKFLKKYHFSFKVLLDKDKAFSKGLGILSLPQTIVIDENGIIIYHDNEPPKKL